jgi:hypothetical protein
MPTRSDHKLSVLSLSLFIIATASVAGDYEYGSVEELKGVSRVYVDARDAVDLRNLMAAVIVMKRKN